jgi:hypothetical protein
VALYKGQRIDRDENILQPMHRLLTSCIGDMQLTKAEVAETQIIVTTPEKWDVVTRKPTGEGELASVRLHIFSRHSSPLTVVGRRN